MVFEYHLSPMLFAQNGDAPKRIGEDKNIRLIFSRKCIEETIHILSRLFVLYVTSNEAILF